MNLNRKWLKLGVCSSALLIAGSVAAYAQDTAVEAVVVTGSRVVSDSANSPTPLTAITTADLQATTPTDIPDALNKLPIFSQQTGAQRSYGAPNGNSAGNVLNLRNFGAQRTLVLLDGHRVTSSNTNGTTDIDTLPQMLMSRVDVTTGGASAIYGSDAVTGVVNFILDKHFDGIKYNANAGISGDGLAPNYQVGIAAGAELFGGRGHIEAAYRYYNQAQVDLLSLPLGQRVIGLTGSGTSASSPITTTSNARVANTSFTGFINGCGTGCTAVANASVPGSMATQFVAPGVLGPWTAGTATGTAGVQSGGDGTYSDATAQPSLVSHEFFSRFSYDLNDKTSAYVQVSAAQSRNNAIYFSDAFPNYGPTTFFKNNPYLSSSAQTALNTCVNSAGVPIACGSSTFSINRYVPSSEIPANNVEDLNRNLSVTAGADGTIFGAYDWDVYYTHGENRLAVDNIGNPNGGKLLAAEDAVVSPGGQISCYDTTPAAGAAANALYAGCVPINMFGPKTITPSAWNYVAETTFFHETNTMDDVGGSVVGTVLQLPAGPLRVALSGESRWLGLTINSSSSPLAKVNCTGLRLCNTASPPAVNGSSVLATLPTVSENVWEFAGESEIPLLNGLPLVQTLDATLAGRYTDYSTTGAAETWKMGLSYHVNDDIAFRGTTSIDIRAPTLNDLYQPLQGGVSGYTDVHTGNYTNPGGVRTQSGGNPDLVPEVARTYTAGVVLTPTFVPGLSFSADWYQIRMKNAVTNVNGTNSIIQNLCEVSGGTSTYCSLYVRPLPFSDHSIANFPSAVLSENLNGAFTQIQGTDFEANYHFDMADLLDGWTGTMSIRELVGWQPVNESQNIAGQPFIYTAQPKLKSTTIFIYETGAWTVGVQNNWASSWNKQSTLATFAYTDPTVQNFDTVDVNLARKFSFGESSASVYLTVQNLFDAMGPIYPINSTNPGYAIPVPPGYPVLGRMFTLGVRGDL